MAFDEPALTIHFRAEGRPRLHDAVIRTRLAAIRSVRSRRSGRVKLYVKRVFITDDAEILPRYLRSCAGSSTPPICRSMCRGKRSRRPAASGHQEGRDGPDSDRIGAACRQGARRPTAKSGTPSALFSREGISRTLTARYAAQAGRFKTTASGEEWRSLKTSRRSENNQTANLLSRPAIESHPAQIVAASRGLPCSTASKCCCCTDPVRYVLGDARCVVDGKPFKSVTQGACGVSASISACLAPPKPDRLRLPPKLSLISSLS